MPRLRYSLSATFNEGVLLNARILGDVDATRENVTQLVDNRLSYDIGRLELRIVRGLQRSTVETTCSGTCASTADGQY